jgi:hypothetical protein
MAKDDDTFSVVRANCQRPAEIVKRCEPRKNPHKSSFAGSSTYAYDKLNLVEETNSRSRQRAQ